MCKRRTIEIRPIDEVVSSNVPNLSSVRGTPLALLSSSAEATPTRSSFFENTVFATIGLPVPGQQEGGREWYFRAS